MTAINLVPPEVLIRRKAKSRLRVWGLRLASGTLVLGLIYAGFNYLAEGQNAEARQMTGRYQLLLDKIRSAESLIRERNRLASRRQAIALISGDRSVNWYLQTLADALTRRSYLEQLALRRCTTPRSDDAADGEPCRADLRITGRAPGHEEVGDIIGRLLTHEAFEEVGLVSSREQQGLTGPAEVEFVIQCLVVEEEE